MIRPILRYGADTLHGTASEVQRFDDDLQRLIDDMVDTMYAAPGVGLAAPQVGVPQRLFIADPSAGRSADDLIILINPRLVEEGGVQREEEGCQSLPGFTAAVPVPLDSSSKARIETERPPVWRVRGYSRGSSRTNSIILTERSS